MGEEKLANCGNLERLAKRMKALSCFLALVVFSIDSVCASDLPSVTVEHLYYLRARGQRVQEWKPEEMIEYCLAQKIGGPAFDAIYAQVSWLRTELMKVTKVDVLPASDPYVRWLNKTLDAYTVLLREEVSRVQNGLIKEGVVAFDTLDAISRAQNQAQNQAQNPPQK